MNVDNPIFIVGAPRSGTTLIRQILDAHPNICCPNWETGIFDCLSLMTNGDFDKYHSKDPTFVLARNDLIAWVRRCTDDLMNQLIASTGKHRWAEKTPAHVFHIELIHEVYPGARFIHIIRDGRDVIRSLQNMPWAPRQIGWSASRWVQSVESGRRAGKQLPSGAYFEMRYEDLIQHPEKTVAAVCGFLGEDYHRQMLDFSNPENNSWGQELTPLQQSPVNRYPKLKWYERVMMARIASPLLRQLGYR